MWGWRRVILRAMGAKIGENVHIYPSVDITIPWNLAIGDESALGARVIVYALGPVSIGNQTTVSQGAHLCAGTHDYREPNMPLVKSRIDIGNGVWVCADAFIGPDVKIGDSAIVGARAVVMKDVSTATIVVGNPAKAIGHR